FVILKQLGRGSFGSVFEAWDPKLNREIALKVPHLHVLFDSDLRQRFVREAETGAGMHHPNIVLVYEAGEAEALPYIASDYFPGTTLSKWLSENGQPIVPCCAAELIATLAEAVDYMHTRGILHRDLKPSNILLTVQSSGGELGPTRDLGSYVAKLTDF